MIAWLLSILQEVKNHAVISIITSCPMVPYPNMNAGALHDRERQAKSEAYGVSPKGQPPLLERHPGSRLRPWQEPRLGAWPVPPDQARHF